MGTRWRGLLAPINQPTGDGRRIGEGAFTHRPLPLPLKWQREDDQGHDASVIIGTLETITIDDKAGEVWGEGELFDDQPDLTRLSEDVKEAIHLTKAGVIGPSVDAGAAEVVWVKEGSDDPLTDDDWEQLIWEEIDTGIAAPLEMLFTLYEIAAATLVAIPAFAEARAFELLDMEPDTSAEAGSPEPVRPAAVTAAQRRQMALTAAAGPVLPPAAVFDPPTEAPAYQLMTVHPRREGENFRRLSGYAAAFGVCHVGHRDACYTAPPTTTDYAMFHRHTFETDAGLVGVGRITTGHGRVGAGCTHLKCRSNDDHACDLASLTETIAHYDQLRTVAHVRATEYEGVGIWVQGILAADADDRDLAVLSRQRVSGDWRPVGAELELVEVLALARETEGFPIPHVAMRDGRQVSLTAAGAVPPRAVLTGRRDLELGAAAKRIGDAVADTLLARGMVFTATGPTSPPADPDTTPAPEAPPRGDVPGAPTVGDPAADPPDQDTDGDVHPPDDTAETLLAEVDAAIEAVAADDRAREAAALLEEIGAGAHV